MGNKFLNWLFGSLSTILFCGLQCGHGKTHRSSSHVGTPSYGFVSSWREHQEGRRRKKRTCRITVSHPYRISGTRLPTMTLTSHALLLTYSSRQNVASRFANESSSVKWLVCGFLRYRTGQKIRYDYLLKAVQHLYSELPFYISRAGGWEWQARA